MQVAIVSTDGVNVNDHFGKATRFLIYEIGPDGQSLLTVRNIETLSIGDRSHSFDQDRFKAVADALEGCKRVYCTKIGDRPADELKQLMVEPVIYQGLIANIEP